MKILVTGGTGYVGSHTCIELLAAGHDVIVIDNLSNSSIAVLERIEAIAKLRPAFHRLDIRDEGGLERLFASQPFDAIMHFAGVKVMAESITDPLKYYSNNVFGSATLFEAAARHGVTNIVFSSSAAVYGHAAVSPVGETSATSPANPYGRTKLIIEGMLEDLCAALPAWGVVALRYFNPVGAHPSGLMGEDPNGVPTNLLPYICQVAARKLPELTVHGGDYPTPDGTAVRDFIHVTDLARGHLAALDYLARVRGMHAINLGTGRGTSVLEMLTTFERVNGLRVPHHVGTRRDGDTVVTYADAALARTHLGWSSRLTLDDICRDAWRWQQANPRGYSP